MNTQEVIQRIRDAIGDHEGSELELYQALVNEADGWEMRLTELEADEEEEDDEDDFDDFEDDDDDFEDEEDDDDDDL